VHGQGGKAVIDVSEREIEQRDRAQQRDQAQPPAGPLVAGQRGPEPGQRQQQRQDAKARGGDHQGGRGRIGKLAQTHAGDRHGGQQHTQDEGGKSGARRQQLKAHRC